MGKTPTLLHSWPQPLVQGTFLKRYKRFFADVELDGQVVVAHVANTGSMKSCLEPGAQALLSPATNPERKLRFSLEALETPSKSWVGVNTALPNNLVKAAFEKSLTSDWTSFDDIKMEHKISKETRLDGVLLKNGKPARYFEIKSVTLAEDDYHAGRGTARFPDAVTERGQKHLRELMKLVDEGAQAEIIYVIQRSDCVNFAPAERIDPEYAGLLRQAREKGVVVRPLVMQVGLDGIHLDSNFSMGLNY